MVLTTNAFLFTVVFFAVVLVVLNLFWGAVGFLRARPAHKNRLTKQEQQDRRTRLLLQAKRDESVAWLGDRYVFAPKKSEK